MIIRSNFRALILAATIVAIFAASAVAQTTAFTYQGRLSEAGTPVTGTRYFRFTLFDETNTPIPGAFASRRWW